MLEIQLCITGINTILKYVRIEKKLYFHLFNIELSFWTVMYMYILS